MQLWSLCQTAQYGSRFTTWVHGKFDSAGSHGKRKDQNKRASLYLIDWWTAQSLVNTFPFMGICRDHISIWIGELRVPESFKFSRSSELMLFGNLNSVGRSLWLADNDLNMSPCQPCQTSLTSRESVFFKWWGSHKLIWFPIFTCSALHQKSMKDFKVLLKL